VPIVRVFYIKKVDLNRQFVVQQSIKFGVRHQSLPCLFLETCLRFIVNVQLSLQDLGFLLRFVVEVYFGGKQPFSHSDQFVYSCQTATVKVGSVLYFTQRRVESLSSLGSLACEAKLFLAISQKHGSSESKVHLMSSAMDDWFMTSSESSGRHSPKLRCRRYQSSKQSTIRVGNVWTAPARVRALSLL